MGGSVVLGELRIFRLPACAIATIFKFKILKPPTDSDALGAHHRVNNVRHGATSRFFGPKNSRCIKQDGLIFGCSLN